MNGELQNIVVVAAIAAAAAYLLYVAIAKLRRRTGKGCGTSCGGCPTEGPLGQPKGFVSLDGLRQSKER